MTIAQARFFLEVVRSRRLGGSTHSHSSKRLNIGRVALPGEHHDLTAPRILPDVHDRPTSNHRLALPVSASVVRTLDDVRVGLVRSGSRDPHLIVTNSSRLPSTPRDRDV